MSKCSLCGKCSTSIIFFSHLDEFTLPSISKGRIKSTVFIQGVLSVQYINAEVTKRGAEHILLSTVFKQAVVERRLGNL